MVTIGAGCLFGMLGLVMIAIAYIGAFVAGALAVIRGAARTVLANGLLQNIAQPFLSRGGT